MNVLSQTQLISAPESSMGDEESLRDELTVGQDAYLSDYEGSATRPCLRHSVCEVKLFYTFP